MNSVEFDKKLLQITITEELDNNILHYNFGKHTSPFDEYKERIFVRDNTLISNLLINESVKIDDIVVAFLSDTWSLIRNDIQNEYVIKRITMYKLLSNNNNT